MKILCQQILRFWPVLQRLMVAMFLVAAVACSDSGEVGSILDEADEVMETHPDSAMKIIVTVQLGHLVD